MLQLLHNSGLLASKLSVSCCFGSTGSLRVWWWDDIIWFTITFVDSDNQASTPMKKPTESPGNVHSFFPKIMYVCECVDDA